MCTTGILSSVRRVQYKLGTLPFDMRRTIQPPGQSHGSNSSRHHLCFIIKDTSPSEQPLISKTAFVSRSWVPGSTPIGQLGATYLDNLIGLANAREENRQCWSIVTGCKFGFESFQAPNKIQLHRISSPFGDCPYAISWRRVFSSCAVIPRARANAQAKLSVSPCTIPQA